MSRARRRRLNEMTSVLPGTRKNLLKFKRALNVFER